MTVALGVDVGTTAVKCALVETATRALVASAYETTGDYVDCGVGRAEQRVDAILCAVQTAMTKLPRDRVREIQTIGICGQMHGIVWWRAADVVRDAEAVWAGGSLKHAAWSRLVTWEDQRCTPSFLEGLNDRVEAAHALEKATASRSSRLSSGYGLATYAHALATYPQSIDGYDACGTIHDLLAFILCGLSRPEDATIDTTNACSWGGFNLDSKNWNDTTVTALGIPTTMLPRVMEPGSVIGRTSSSAVLGLPANVPVYVPMGDHPCSVVASISQQKVDDSASSTSGLSLVNIGTSAQLAMILPHHATRSLVDSSAGGFEIRPFITDDQVLGVAAALSGGNMFAWLVRQSQQWIAELLGESVDAASNPDATTATYKRLIDLGLKKVDTDLIFCPTLNGERATPDASGHIDALRLNNASLGDLSASLCRGLIHNLVDMVPLELQGHFRASRMIGTGNALVRNALLQHFLARQLNDVANLRLQDAADAAVGAALVSAGASLNLS